MVFTAVAILLLPFGSEESVFSEASFRLSAAAAVTCSFVQMSLEHTAFAVKVQDAIGNCTDQLRLVSVFLVIVRGDAIREIIGAGGVVLNNQGCSKVP